MQLRNRLKAGEFIEILPIGIPVILKYKDTGNLEAVYIGNDLSETSLKSNEIYSACVKSNLVPMHLNTHGGTLWIRGIAYTGKMYDSTGLLPDCFYDQFLQDIVNGIQFNIFTGYIDATSINFSNITQIRTWLRSNGFNLLPGFLLGNGDADTYVAKFISTTQFDESKISGFYAIREDLSIISLDYEHHKVLSTHRYLDPNGYLLSEIIFENNQSTNIPYKRLLDLDIRENDFIILDSDKHTIRYNLSHKPNTSTYVLNCDVCGKVFELDSDYTVCDNPHCLSHMYNDIIHFLKRLDLVELSYDEYMEYVNSGTIHNFSDILSLNVYSDLLIEVSLHRLLDAIIPVYAVRNRDTIWEFCTKCNDSYDSIYYYMMHPNSIFSDLNLLDGDLVRWFSDPVNVDQVNNIIRYTNIVLVSQEAKFDGSPILRGKKIYITGKFKHGSNAEITSIIKSYSGEISNVDEATLGLIGDIPEEINGGAINKLKNSKIPVLNESEFFNHYGIDEDLELVR